MRAGLDFVTRGGTSWPHSTPKSAVFRENRESGRVSLNLWRKRVGAPKQGERPLPLLFLVHGSSNSARSSYDLTLAGKGEYSFMNVFALRLRRMDHGP
jgi:hypothetical protein